MMDLAADPERLSKVFSEAAAPAFFLGAVIGLVSILMSRLGDVMGQLRTLPEGRAAERPVLRRRAALIHSAMGFAVSGGVCTTLLLALAFTAAFFRQQHVYGAAILFLAATVFVGLALVRFSQEIRAGMKELDRYL